MIKEAIIDLVKKQDIGGETAAAVMDEIMTNTASDVQKAAYLTALNMKGATVDEITGSALAMRGHALHLEHNLEDLLEIVGTGGDGSNSFNISTTSSIVIAAAGVPIAKHGNRAASSKCGAADVLEALGVKIDIPVEKSKEILEKNNICFLFAQLYHSSMRYVGGIRKELAIPTIFNILGPLANPANANIQLMGVYDVSLVKSMANVLSNLGVKRGMVVFGQDKLDEISMCAPTTVCEINNGEFTDYEIKPQDFGFEPCDKSELTGGTPQENAEITLSVLKGEKGAKRNAVVMNAGAALYLAGKAESIKGGIRLAEEIIDSGKAMETLNNFIQLSNA